MHSVDRGHVVRIFTTTRAARHARRERIPNASPREAIERAERGLIDHRTGITNDGNFRKITLRQLGPDAPHTAAPMSGEDIRKLREQAQLSQAALARYLNLTVGYVSQLECGRKQATGPALALLNVIRRKGMEAIF